MGGEKDEGYVCGCVSVCVCTCGVLGGGVLCSCSEVC